MKKNIITIILLLGALTSAMAQGGINKNTPSVTLEIAQSKDANKIPHGLLVPKLTEDEVKAKKYSKDQQGVMLFVKGGMNGMAEGFYYFDGVKWNTVDVGTKNSFTARVASIKLNSSNPNWSDYSDYNYLQINAGSYSGSELEFPKAADFAGMTITLQNNLGRSLDFLNIPPELLPHPQATTPLKELSKYTAQKYYSTGTKWYKMAGK